MLFTIFSDIPNRKTREDGLQLPKVLGTMITRIVLSALPDTKTDESALKRNVVGGNSCAFKIDRSG
jgi:hypothetical protein